MAAIGRLVVGIFVIFSATAFALAVENAKSDTNEINFFEYTRDPFMPPDTMAEITDVNSQISLTGIITSHNENKALINDQILPVGSRIGKFRIKEILKDTVIITDGKEEIKLEVKQ
ncbi:MAG: hypothetical protein JXB40_04365 [Candidatus Omnitrophica bacterium]|nr:hypothetical protein [Candidatus Omnitrophota bacterium]